MSVVDDFDLIVEEHGSLWPGDSASFWSQIQRWLWRTTLLIAAFKVGLTLLYAGVVQEVGITLGFWWGFVPHFGFDLDQDKFVRLVTMSSWFGVLGMLAAWVWALVAYRRSARDFDEFVETKPLTGQEERFFRFAFESSRLGLAIGALVGSCALLVTIVLELLRDRFIDAYVWPRPHIWLITVSLVPVLALAALAVSGAMRAARCPVAQVTSLLVAGGVGVIDESSRLLTIADISDRGSMRPPQRRDST